MLDSPLTETLIRLTTRIDLPQNRAIICMKLPDLRKNESPMTTTPHTKVAKTTQIAMYKVRIIPTSPNRSTNISGTIPQSQVSRQLFIPINFGLKRT